MLSIILSLLLYINLSLLEDVYEIHDEEKDTQAEAEDLEGVEIDPELISKVEELRKRTKIDRNIADQDVDKLAVFHFNGEFYICKLCKIVTKSHKVCLYSFARMVRNL